jgi:hypothetical protein
MSTELPKTISWEAPEYRYYEKNAAWYVTLLCVTLLIGGFLIIIQQDIFGAVCVGIIAALLVFFSRQLPEPIVITLSQRGVTFGDISIPYKNLKHFWIVTEDEHRVLNIETMSWLNNHLILELMDEDPELVRSFLLRHLAEHHENTLRFSQKIAHRLRF